MTDKNKVSQETTGISMSKRAFLRRTVLVGSAMFLVTVPVLVGVLNSNNNMLVVAENGQFFTAEQMTMLVDVAEIMIPKTDTPGATDAQVIPVLDGMMLSWAGEKTKTLFSLILTHINQLSRDRFREDYQNLSQQDRTDLLVSLDEEAFAIKTSAVSEAYRKLKEIIFHIYYTSEPANPDYMAVPGNYRGSVTQEEIIKFNLQGRVT